MNIQLKQRLVGALVLVSLAVVAIPMLLPGEGEMAKSSRGSSIPAEPDYRFVPLEDAPPAPTLAESPPVPMELPSEPAGKAKAAQNAAKSHAPKASAKLSTKPDLPIDAVTPKKPAAGKKDDGQVTAWVVQVGSFSRAKNAQALRDKLRKQGFASFVEAVKEKSGKSVYRVRVGPEVRRDLADKLQQQLVSDAGLTGIVLRYP